MAATNVRVTAPTAAASLANDVVEPPQKTARVASKVRAVLGTMTFQWSGASRVCDKPVCEEMFKIFAAEKSHIEVDTAFLYSGGKSEEVIGEMLPADPAYKRFQIATKAAPWSKLITGAGGTHGASGGAGGLTPKLLRYQVETSLKRMKVPSVQLLYLHAPDVDTPLKETLAEVAKLHKEGKFVELGLSNFSAWEVVHVWHLCAEMGIVKPTVYQGMYNAITRTVEQEVFPALQRLGIRFLCYNPLAGGLLTGKHDFTKEPAKGRFKNNSMYTARFWKKEYFSGLALVQQACAKHSIPLTDASLRWLTCHSELKGSVGDGIIIGASSVGHLKANLAAIDAAEPLPKDVVEAYDKAWEICRPACPKYFRP